MNIYLDESGDLGFSKGSSKFFVVTLLFTRDSRPLGRCLKKARHKKLKKSLRERPEIKAYESTNRIRKQVLTCLATKDIEIHSVVLNKKNVYPRLRKVKNKLYNYVTGLLIEDCAQLSEPTLTLVVDKRATGRIIEEFDNYIRFKVDSKLSQKPPTLFRIYHKPSESDPGIQAVDFISYAVFRELEYSERELYSLIDSKVTVKKRLFF